MSRRVPEYSVRRITNERGNAGDNKPPRWRSKTARILTDVSEPRAAVAWQRQTDLFQYPGGRGLVRDVLSAFRFWRRGRKYDIVVTGGSRVASLLAIFCALWPGRSAPICMIDCLWRRPTNRVRQWLKRLQVGLMSRAVRRFVVWASHEVRDYATCFGLPEEKFLYVPHHHTLEGYDFETFSGEYIFSGGDGDRDYPTLLQAVRGLGVKVVIAARRRDWHGGRSVPDGVQAFPNSHAEFRRWMAGSRMVVVPMKKGLLHSAGQQTYLNAMAMGKPVIVADDKGARDYIENGVNGIIVPAGDAEALRAAIKLLLTDPHYAARLAGNAKRVYEIYSTPRCMEIILGIAEEIVVATNRKETK